jgi:sugar lactone lactonase YvrE
MRVRRALLAAGVAAVVGGSALGAGGGTPSYPATIPLPDGFQPEGIAIAAQTFYVGSIPTGAVYRGNLRTGRGAVLVRRREGRSAIGVAVDSRRRLFVAGGQTGRAFVYDGRNGRALAAFALTDGQTFVNDVAVTRTGAWFTDSVNPVLYRVPIGAGGRLGAARTVPLSGDIEYVQGFNVNGIDATPDGRRLVIVQSNTGMLFTVNPANGAARAIDLGGGSVPNGDGILLDGRTLYVVQNQLNRIAVVRLDAALTSGRIVGTVTDPDFDVPTTVDDLGDRLYAVNARFGTTPGPDTEYQVVQVRKPGG